MTGSAKPEMEFKVGAVRAAIWTNPRMTGNGKMFNSPKVVLDRIYRDGDGSFQTTASLDLNDIPKAILALKKAYEYLTTNNQKTSNVDTGVQGNSQLPTRIP